MNLNKITLEGEMRYFINFPRQDIGGPSHPREIEVVFDPPKKQVEPVVSLLELEFIGKEFHYDRWRLWFNNISIAREIKPAMSIKLDDREKYYKAVFDIAPLMMGRPSDKYMFRIRYFHTAPLRVHKIGLLLAYSEKDSQTTLLYTLKPIVVSEAKRLEISTQLEPKYNLYITGLARGSSSIAMNCEKPTIVEEPLLDITKICEDSKLVLDINASEKEPVVISSIVAYKMKRPEPYLLVDLKREEEKLIITIKNKGTAATDNAIVLVTAAGNILYRKRFPSLKPGEHLEIETPYNKNTYNTIRIIARYRGETRIYEKKLKPG